MQTSQFLKAFWNSAWTKMLFTARNIRKELLQSKTFFNWECCLARSHWVKFALHNVSLNVIETENYQNKWEYELVYIFNRYVSKSIENSHFGSVNDRNLFPGELRQTWWLSSNYTRVKACVIKKNRDLGVLFGMSAGKICQKLCVISLFSTPLNTTFCSSVLC